MFQEAVDADEAPAWIADNLSTIKTVERKMLNTHDFLENLSLAFTFCEKIDPGDRIKKWRQRSHGVPGGMRSVWEEDDP